MAKMGRRSARERKDPTRQATNRDRSTRKLDGSLTAAKRRVLSLLSVLPVSRSTETVVVNQEKAVFTYDITPDQLERMLAEVRAILNSELLQTQQQDMPPDWWWKPEVEHPYRQGATQELIQFNQLIAAAVIAGLLTRTGLPPQRVPAELILSSPTYIQGLNRAYVENWQAIKGMSDTTATQVGRVISDGIQSGLSKSDIAAQIADRFNVASSRAKQIAHTQINAAYNDARMDATKAAAEQAGLRAGVIHISALLPTTRQTHADRHGNAYTVADQLAWWNEGANRINCYCSTRSVLLDAEGRVVNTKIQEELKAEVAG